MSEYAQLQQILSQLNRLSSSPGTSEETIAAISGATWQLQGRANELRRELDHRRFAAAENRQSPAPAVAIVEAIG